MGNEQDKPIGAGPIRLGLVGIGKIARDQHVPALQGDPRFEIVATASRDATATLDGVPAHHDIAAMIAGGHDLDAVSLCTPPAGRRAIALTAIEAGLHVMLEKPPAATLSEAEDLIARARANKVTLFTSWHSRAASGVEAAKAWLADRRIESVRIAWKEDIRRWHPGQEWILAEGGFGVFDPGINALSIVSAILPDTLIVEAAEIDIPEGRASPIAARLRMRSGAASVEADFDFLQTGPQSWNITVETDVGPLRLADGGATLTIGDAPAEAHENHEYAGLYARFADLIATGQSDIDLAPLRLVADAFLVAKRLTTERFDF